MAKKYKCRVEYLESTGTQWIDTGIAPSNITPVAKLKFIPTQQYSSGNYGIFGCFGANNTRFQIFYNSIGIGTYVSKSWQTNTTYEVELNGKTPSTTINGSVETSGYSKANGFSSYNMYLFTRNNGDVADNGVPLKLYYCKIWDNNTLVRDLIPVLDNTGRPAMYDQVSGQLFYNKGTGEFTYGRQIIPVEYLESVDAQYIATGVTGGLETEVVIDAMVLGYSENNTSTLFGNISGNIGISILLSSNGTARYSRFGSKAVITKNEDLLNVRQTFTINKTALTFGSSSYVFNEDTSFSISDLALFDIASTTDSYYSPIRVYSCKIKDNGTLIRDFIPCIDENLTPFMFDKVNNTVYLNAGTGQFKVGPNVEKVWGGKKLRRKLALALANLKKKRKYYCEVEYLESTGTQWIDTGLDYFADFEVGIQLRTNVSNKALGNGAFYCMQRYNQANPYWYFSTGSGASNSYTSSTPITEHHVMRWKDNKIYADGVLLTEFTKDLNTPNRMYLYATGSSNKYPNVIYFCKLWNPDNGELVRDFIPVLDWNMTPCMYDRVTEQLFYNKGTGDFIAGREIHPVEYLESTGTQYINTGLLSTASSTVDTEFSFTSMESGAANNVGVFGGRNGTTSNTFTFFKIASATPQYFRFDYNGQPQVATASDMTWNTASKYRFQYNGTNCITTNTTTGESTVLTRSPGSTFTQYPIHLFAVNTAGGIGQHLSGRIYYYKYSDGTNSVDMVPAIDENGVGFMLDRVSHTIYDNAGTGAFKYPAREVEYIESTGTQYIDTGIQPTDDYGYKIINTYTRGGGEQCAIGCMDNGNRFVGIYTSGSENQLSGAWGYYVGFLPNYPWTTGTILEVKCNYKNDRKIIIDQTEMKDITDTHISGTISNSIYIGARHYGTNITKMRGKIYGVEITNGQNVVADFIPAFKDGQIGMYDKVGGVLKTNTGTGSFSKGKIVEPEYE